MRKSSHPKFLESASRNQHGNPAIPPLVTSSADGDPVFSRAWCVHASHINPEREKVADFGENEFRTQNLNVYRLSYELLIHFGELDTTHLMSLHIPIKRRTRVPDLPSEGTCRVFSFRRLEGTRPQSFDALDWCMETKKRSRLSILSAANSGLKFSFQRETRILDYRG